MIPKESKPAQKVQTEGLSLNSPASNKIHFTISTLCDTLTLVKKLFTECIRGPFRSVYVLYVPRADCRAAGTVSSLYVCTLYQPMIAQVGF